MRAHTHHDLEAWAAFQQSLEGTVLTWLHDHPGRETACRVQSERHFVAQAFEQLRQAVIQRHVTFETLPEALLYHTNQLSERLNQRKKGDDLWRPQPKY